MFLDLRVSLGARWMDKRYPRWHEEISVGDLAPTDYRCIIGQVEGDFRDVMSRKHPIANAMPSEGRKWLFFFPIFLPSIAFIYGRGFDTLNETDLQWKNAWIREIEKRKALFVPPAWEEEASDHLAVFETTRR